MMDRITDKMKDMTECELREFIYSPIITNTVHCNRHEIMERHRTLSNKQRRIRIILDRRKSKKIYLSHTMV